MSQVWSFVSAHQTSAALIAFWIGSNVISSLPSPDQNSWAFYKFFFAFAHGLAGSIPRVFPQLRVFDPTQGSGTYFQKQPTTTQPPPGGGN